MKKKIIVQSGRVIASHFNIKRDVAGALWLRPDHFSINIQGRTMADIKDTFFEICKSAEPEILLMAIFGKGKLKKYSKPINQGKSK